MKKIKISILICSIVFIFILLNTGVLASETIVASGTFGDDLSWVLDDVGTLIISGDGEMAEFSSEKAVPWYSYTSDIKGVIIKSGVTSITGYAFYD